MENLNLFDMLGIKEEAGEEKKIIKPKSKSVTTTVKEEKYNGPRPVKANGQVIYIEENPDVSLEEVRQKLVDEYGYEEYSKERTLMSFDKSTGIIVPTITGYKSKG